MILWLVNILPALHLASLASSYLMSDFEKTNSFMLSSNKINYDFEYINIKSSSKAFLSRVCLWHARSISCQVIFMLLQPILKLEYISCTMDSQFWLNLLRVTKIISNLVSEYERLRASQLIVMPWMYAIIYENGKNAIEWWKQKPIFRKSLWSALLSTFIVCKINSSFKLWYQLG